MLIEIECPNLSDFDAASGRSVYCNHRMMVDSNQVGERIVCPQCRQEFEIESPQPGRGDSKLSPSPSVSTQAGREAGSKPNRNASRSRKSNAGSVSVPAKKTSSAKSQLGRQARSRSTDDFAAPDILSDDLDDDQLASALADGPSKRCRRCGDTITRGKCSSCGLVEPRYVSMYQPIDKIKPRLAGMQLWLSETLSEGMPIKTLTLVMHGLVTVPALLLTTLAILGIAGAGMGVVPGIILLVVTVTLTLLYVGLIYQGKQFVRNPRARLAWFQRPFWNLILFVSRALGWEKYDSRLANRRVIKVRDRSLSDEQIGQLKGIRDAQVLDLENTSITDQGLAQLYRLDHLQCLVVRKTKVTQDGVFRLQQARPKMWIWS